MKNTTEQSKRGKLNKTDWAKILKGAVIAAIGAFMAYLGQALGLVEPSLEVIEGVVGGTVDGEMVADGYGCPPMFAYWLFSIFANLLYKLWRDSK